ncbi:hypothetical protein AX15_007369, partial [Amanita polypyramis BW_CC]
DREEWTAIVAHIITPILQERCLVVVASPPTNVKRQTGVVRTILLQPNATPVATTEQLPFSNHHELSLAGLITNLPWALTSEGNFTILLRNQSACYTLFNERNALNAYYQLEFNNIIHPWLTNPRNRLFIGWLPAGIPTPPLLPYVLNLSKLKQHSVPPTYYSPATSWRLAKERAKLDTLDHLRPKTWGKHFPDLGVMGPQADTTHTDLGSIDKFSVSVTIRLFNPGNTSWTTAHYMSATGKRGCGLKNPKTNCY